MKHTLTKPIAEGRTAEVYEWNDGTILKLYHDWCPSHWVEYESHAARAVVTAGIPTPAATEIVEVNGRRGIVYERVKGISMLQDMNARPWMIFQHARSLAELHVKINQLSISGLYSAKDGLANSIRNAPHLSEILCADVLERLASLPNGEKVCHGDFHPGNVMLTERGPVVIDWMTVSTGDPWADFARTSILLTIGPKGAGRLLNPLVKMMIALFYQTYSRHYLQRMHGNGDEYKKWMPVLAAARLNEQIEPEWKALVEMVEQGIK